jgi:hypothetical protein
VVGVTPAASGARRPGDGGRPCRGRHGSLEQRGDPRDRARAASTCSSAGWPELPVNTNGSQANTNTMSEPRKYGCECQLAGDLENRDADAGELRVRQRERPQQGAARRPLGEPVQLRTPMATAASRSSADHAPHR